jgi:3-oxoacyl-[acyl-carrier protein] reductase
VRDVTDGPLAGRVALVTGATRRRGIGAAIARRLAEAGAAVCVHSFAAYDAAQPWAEAEGPEGVVEELRGLGATLGHVEADLADPDAPAQVVERCRAELGRLDIVVANHARSIAQTLETLSASEVDAHMAVNVRATLLLLQAFAAQHDGASGGRAIVLLTGQHRGPMPGELPYVASKGALHQLVPTLAAVLAPRGITVNGVNPGPTDTGWAPAELYAEIEALAPQGRWSQPDDAARLVAWLATDEARWVTGQVIDSTGGL